MALLLLAMIGVVHAQEVDIRIIEERPGGVVAEISANWPTSLKQEIDSLGANTVSTAVIGAVARGYLDISETFPLPTLAQPRLRILSSEHDEIPLPGEFEGGRPAVTTMGLGLLRKTPVITLVARLVTYNNGILRRYRRIRVAIDYDSQDIVTVSPLRKSDSHLSLSQSVLADGRVFKIPITEEGIYVIDRDFLSGLGLNPDTIEPDNLRIYGNGGAPLPAINNAPRAIDLKENPILVRGGGDGSFGSNDRLLLYARGPTGWRYLADDEKWEHYVNPFSTENYYFLKIDDETGLRIEETPFPNFTDAIRVNSVTGRLVRDIDEFNWSKQNGSGHTWISNPISPDGRLDILVNETPLGLLPGEINYSARVAIQSNPAAFAFFDSGPDVIGQVRTGSVGSDQEAASARLATVDFSESIASGEGLDISMRVERQNGSPSAALDWLRAFYPQSLTTEVGYLRFATPISGRYEMALSGFSSEPFVWDVTDVRGITALAGQASNGTYNVQMDLAGGPREMVVFEETSASRLDPGIVIEVNRQNLHGIVNFPDFVIVTPSVFRPYAEELAEHRRKEGLEVLVADTEEIYNEFGGGLTDMRALRDYLKFLYDRATTEEQLLRYVLLFGDGHFNYRNLGADQPELNNWILPYETEDSFVPDKTFTSDDYFGLLDDDEGLWPYQSFSVAAPPGELVERVDIGIGRITVQTEEEARAVLDKIKHYESPETNGPWRTRYTFIADDGPTGLSGTQNDRDLHLQNADVVAQLVREKYPEVNLSKVYASSFDRVFRNGWRIPGAENEINSILHEGTLLMNYSGHGGEDGLAQESLFTSEDAKEAQNGDVLSVFITATCSFGWWDLQDHQSGAEELLLNPNGGAVALLTTVRLVYTSSDINSLNVGLNRDLTTELLRREEDGSPRRLGDVLRDTKNTQAGLQGNNRKFNLLGDPTMRLGLPRNDVSVVSINEVSLDAEQGQVRALDRVRITGQVQDQNTQIETDFNGAANITVFDAERRIRVPEQRHMPTPYYIVREDLIWRGQVDVNAGKFSAEFVVPKDIAYTNDTGRISVYASSANRQVVGFTENFIVGGTSDNPPNDSQGPQISLFLNDTTFVSGGLTYPEPELIVKLFDESGINTVGAGVGHEMLLVINGKEEEAVDISNRFRSEGNSFQRGIVNWPLPAQEEGANSLSVRSWDVLNNSNSAEIEYYVTASEDLELRNVFNYPNPTSGQTRFVFEHNQPQGTIAKIQIRIFTLSGLPVKTIETEELLPGGPFQLAWSGLDEDMDRLATGVYLYKLRVAVESPEGDKQVAEQIEKLVILR